MYKLKLNNGTIITISEESNIHSLICEGKSIEELEALFTKENCSELQMLNSDNETFAIFNNFECISIERYSDGQLVTHLKEIDNIECKLEQLQSTIDVLVLEMLSI